MSTSPPPGYEGAQRVNGQQTKTDVEARIATASGADAIAQSAATVEELVRLLGTVWGEAGLTPEQCVFSLALVTINYRETVPDKFGGKDMFDRIAAEARRYYNDNVGK